MRWQIMRHASAARNRCSMSTGSGTTANSGARGLGDIRVTE
jgi:hypothetical protein